MSFMPSPEKNHSVNFIGTPPESMVALCSLNNISIIEAESNADIYLSFDNNTLQLFVNALSPHPIPQLNEKHFQINYKSIAGKSLGKKTKTVMDATAGLGGDSIMFAKMGFNVIAVERQAYTFLLLTDNIRRSGLANSVQCVFANSMTTLSKNEHHVDAVFFDPMYPEKQKSALPNIRMRALALLSQAKDDDFEAVLAFALTLDNKRIVVKRPDHSPVLDQKKLVHSYKGKAVRYDAYISKSD